MIIGSGSVAGISSFHGQIGIADRFDVWAFIPVETEEAQTPVIGNFLTFPRRGIASDFDTGWKSLGWRKLERFLDRDRLKPFLVSFCLSGFPFYFIMQYEDAMPWQHVGPIPSSPKENLLPHIHGVCIVGGNSHSSPWLVITAKLTETWLVYLQKSTIYMICITTYPPKWCSCIECCMDSVAYVTRTYSYFEEETIRHP
jgi:hypothetical protein